MSKKKEVNLGDGNRIWVEGGIVRFEGNYSTAARCLLEKHLGAEETKSKVSSASD